MSRHSKKEIKDQDRRKPAKRRKIQQWFPAGWDEQRVRQVLAHYENQTDEERAAEIGGTFQAAK
jgi:hypothetical protein